MIVLFFFQAEDGIRDLYVTGVQTCALPISLHARQHAEPVHRPTNDQPETPAHNAASWHEIPCAQPLPTRASPVRASRVHRSEERRVGKECRSRWVQEHLRKKYAKSRVTYAE